MAGTIRICETPECEKEARSRGRFCNACRGRKYRQAQIDADPVGNHALGKFKDDVRLLARAITYLHSGGVWS